MLRLTTAYSVREIDDIVSKKRKRPSRTNINARVILPAFKEDRKDVGEKVFNIPKIFHYYNKHMREINRFNALMTAYSSQRAYNRNWMPLFNWHLDASLVNAYCLCEPSRKERQEHQKFLEQVVMKLLKEGDISARKHQPPPPVTILPRLLRGNHNWQDLKGSRTCIQCRIDIKGRGFGREISDNSGISPRTRGGCKVCKVFLCRKGDCVKRFHERIVAM